MSGNKKGGDFCYEKKDGTFSDRWIHEELLGEKFDDPEPPKEGGKGEPNKEKPK